MVGVKIVMNNKISNNDELKERLKKFCKKNNLNLNIFEIAIAGKGYGSGARKVLYGPSKVTNIECIYVIKLFIKYNIIIIWNYKNNSSMSYPYETLKERLNRGKIIGDKGKGYHPYNQSEILFEHTENFENLLYKIANKR